AGSIFERQRGFVVMEKTMEKEQPVASDNVLATEVQLLLAEKRTSLSALRTGISVLVLPLSVLSVLITTSRFYNVVNVAGMLVPLLVLAAALVILGVYLIVHAIRRIHHYDRLIRKIKLKHSAIAEFIE